MSSIRVALVEDDNLIRILTYDYLRKQPELQCIICADSAEDLLAQLIYSLLPQVILLDIGLPGMSGLEAIPRILVKVPKAQILILTVLDDTDNIYKALGLGATGYILKGTSLPIVKKSILEIVQGGVPFSQSVAHKVLTRFHPIPRPKPLSLSPREQQVFDGLVDGMTTKQVAWRLQLKVESVRSYIKSIYQKLQVSNRAGLLNQVLRDSL